MVSFHNPLSPTRRKMMPEFENLTKKRKWEESQPGETSEKQSIAKTMKPVFDTEQPRLEAPLPLEWQRCLDIKSGQLYFYNTRTHKRTSSDPRIKQEQFNPVYMSLDLQLNLPCGSVGKKQDDNHIYMTQNSSSNSQNSSDRFMGSSRDNNNTGSLTRSPSWLTIEGDQREMVTAVCKKCHMLVIMCKSSPSCPNCKFVHPPNQSPPSLFDKRLSLVLRSA